MATLEVEYLKLHMELQGLMEGLKSKVLQQEKDLGKGRARIAELKGRLAKKAKTDQSTETSGATEEALRKEVEEQNARISYLDNKLRIMGELNEDKEETIARLQGRSVEGDVDDEEDEDTEPVATEQQETQTLPEPESSTGKGKAKVTGARAGDDPEEQGKPDVEILESIPGVMEVEAEGRVLKVIIGPLSEGA